MSIENIQKKEPLAIFDYCTARFVLDFVEDPEGRFSHDLGRVRTSIFSLTKTNCHRNCSKLFAFTNSYEMCQSNYVKESLLMYFLCCCVHTNDNNSANILKHTHLYV